MGNHKGMIDEKICLEVEFFINDEARMYKVLMTRIQDDHMLDTL
jgi:hypothetical protein